MKNILIVLIAGIVVYVLLAAFSGTLNAHLWKDECVGGFIISWIILSIVFLFLDNE